MKKSFFVLPALGILCAFFIPDQRSSAQGIPNADFEMWTPFPGYDEPDGWVTTNPLSDFPWNNPVETFQTTGIDAYTGTYGLKVVTITLTNNPAPGLIPNIVSSVFTGTFTGTNVIFGTPYSGRPDSMMFYFKYFPSGVDTGASFVSMTKYDALSNSTILVGDGMMTIDTATSAFSLGVVPITYYTADIPDTTLIFLFSSADTLTAVDGSFLIADALAFSDAMPTVSQIEQDTLLYDLMTVVPPVDVSQTIVAWNDSAMLNGAQVTITSNFLSAEDSLSFTSSAGITGSFSSVTGTLLLSGSATFADYQTVLRSVNYKNFAGTPTFSIRKVEFTVNDALNTSNVGHRYIHVFNSTGISGAGIQVNIIKVFPSPAKDEIFITGIPKGANAVAVFDMLGKVVSSQKISGRQPEFISTKDLQNGIYFLQVTGEKEQVFTRKKFIIIK